MYFSVRSIQRCLRVGVAIEYPILTLFQRETVARSSWNSSTRSTIRLLDFRSRFRLSFALRETSAKLCDAFHLTSGYFWWGVVLRVRRCLHPGLVPRCIPCIQIHHRQGQRLISLTLSVYVYFDLKHRHHKLYIVLIHVWNSSCWWYAFNWINDGAWDKKKSNLFKDSLHSSSSSGLLF